MPELPEVETIRRQLAIKIVGKKLNGKKIVDVKRRAKILIIDFSDGSSLVFHLKLTGQLIFNGQPGRHTRQVFNFSDGTRLIFNDARKFGWWKNVENVREMKEIKQLGPEALKIKESEFKNRLLKRRQAKIKPLLMDQKFLAGIGNIYSDEILFEAKIHPLRIVKTLSPIEISRLFLAMKKILKKAIAKGGSSVEYYLDALGKKGGFVPYHKVYQRTGKPCLRCGGIIKRLKIGGRSAHFCPDCQK